MQWPFQEQAGRDRAEPRRWHLRPSVAGEAFLFTSENDSGRSSVACPIFTAPYWPPAGWNCTFKSLSSWYLSPFEEGFFKRLASWHLCVILHNVKVACLALATHPPTPKFPLLPCRFSHSISRSIPSVLWFLIPKGVSWSADITGVFASPPPLPIQYPPTHPCLACAYAEKGSISAVAAAKHHTTKEMRTSDSNHQEGRWQNKGGRWWSERQRCAEGCKKERERAFFPLSLFFHIFFFFFPRIHQAPLDTCLTGVALISPEGRVPLSPLHATPSRSPFLFLSIYISKQAMSRSKTVTNDEAFHQRLAWYAEIVYSEVSLIISRWVCCLAPVCVLWGSCHCFIPSLSLGARRR